MPRQNTKASGDLRICIWGSGDLCLGFRGYKHNPESAHVWSGMDDKMRPWTRLGVFGSFFCWAFGTKNDVFPSSTHIRCLWRFLMFSLLLFSFISACFGRARKRPKGQIRHTLRAKPYFFKVHACAGFAARTTTDGQNRFQKRFQ